MAIPSTLKPFARLAWKPLVIEGDGTLTDAKFSGQPWLADGESYPCCTNCGKPMQLFLQLNLDTLPEPIQGQYGTGLLQLFYCTSETPLCEVDCEAFFPFAQSVLARLVQPTDQPHPVSPVTLSDPFPAKTIVGWEEMVDYPNPEEGTELGIELNDEEWEQVTTEESVPRSGDKLAGYPLWIQGMEYPACPDCGQPMRLVFQLDSEDHLPYMFGDVGCGHITQCPEHHHQLAFGWACG